MDDSRLRLRSYRSAFVLERRIHRIDSFRIPLPYGLPLAALGWGAGSAIALVVLSGVPVMGAVVLAVPWPARLIFLPGLAAHLLCRTTSDGRPLHETLVANAAFALRPRLRLGLQRVPWIRPEASAAVVALAADERSAEYRPGTVNGPASVRLRQPARLTLSGRRVRLSATADRPMLHAQEVHLHDGQRLVIT